MNNTIIHLHDSCFPSQKGDFKAKYIILHDIKFDIYQTEKLFRERKLSSHYYISSQGKVYEFAKNKAAYHAGSSSAFKNDKDLNSNSIGIETQSSWEYNMPRAQYQELVRLIKEIMAECSISPSNILSHAEIAPYRLAEDGSLTYGKSDPGINFPWRQLSQEGLGCYHDAEINPAPKVMFCFADQDQSAENQGIKNIQIALHNFGYVFTPVNGVYDMPTAAVLNAFYLRYYPEWFTINKGGIKSSIIKALQANNMVNVKGDVQDQYAIGLKELEYGDIDDKWIFEHMYHLDSSNIDENALLIMKQILKI